MLPNYDKDTLTNDSTGLADDAATMPAMVRRAPVGIVFWEILLLTPEGPKWLEAFHARMTGSGCDPVFRLHSFTQNVPLVFSTDLQNRNAGSTDVLEGRRDLHQSIRAPIGEPLPVF